MLRIGVNLMYLRPGIASGTARYVKSILKYLAALEDTSVTVYCSSMAEDLVSGISDIERVIVSDRQYTLIGRIITENWVLRKHLSGGVDVLFSPANFAAPALPSRTPQVVTVHDLQHLRLPMNFARTKRYQRSVMFWLSFRRCKAVIAISGATRSDILSFFRIPADRVVVIPHGFDRSATPDPHRAQGTIRRYGLIRPFVFYPATDNPHKNHRTLVEGFQRLVAGDSDTDLVLTGLRSEPGMSSKQQYEGLELLIGRLGLADRVHHLGYVSDDDVTDLMLKAEALVFPSLFEGFGLPLLSAMHSRTPVITTQNEGIRETVGEAAYFVANASDPEEWAQAIRRVLTDSELRNDLIERGTSNLERFSWERSARATREVLCRVAQTHGDEQ